MSSNRRYLTAAMWATATVVGAAWGPAVLVPGEPVRAWQILGPFPASNVLCAVAEDESALNPAAHPVVAGKAWKYVAAPDGIVDLQAAGALGDADRAVAFAYAEIESDGDGPVELGVGSDDAVVVWWNGRRVLVQDVLRALRVGQDRVHVQMRKGRNTLLLKVYDETGAFGCAAHLRPLGEPAWAWRVVTPPDDEGLLDLIERHAFDYFWNEAHPETGLVPDRVPEEGPATAPCSVAALGFGLTGVCIAESRGWVPYEKAVAYVRRVLRFMLERSEHERGFFYHFLDSRTGKRAWQSEVSSIDTALFLAGALTCRQYFRDPEISARVDELYRRVDWPWMLDGADVPAMAWRPEEGFTPARWDTYSEHMILYLLGLGSPSHPLPPKVWHAWKRPLFTYEGMTYIQGVPLFLHQYAHAWVDFRGRRDAYADYFHNSRLATLAHRAFCLNLRDRFPHFSEKLWGFTASLSPGGYAVWGGPPTTLDPAPDGTVVPCAAGGSLPFAPEATWPVLRELYHNYRHSVWGKYGFRDAFHPQTGWVADSYLGIDQGILLLMIENYRTGNVWKWFMSAPEIERALARAGFKETARELDPAELDYLRVLARDTWACLAHFVHPETGLPYDSSDRAPHTSATNIGLYLAALAAAREMGFISAEEALQRAERVVSSLEKMPTWNGFQRCWHGVADLAPASHDPWISAVDSGNLAMGLTVAAQAFPELRERCQRLVRQMNWSALYDAHAGLLYGGYDPEAGRVNPDWHVDALGSDSRAALFMAIAGNRVAPEAWMNLRRDMTERHHVRILQPGWVGGGLFMQYLTGIFLDERQSLAGRSAANLAYANMIHADELGFDVWGWSSCRDPAGGYLGWGNLRDDVVTPHASALAIEDFPREVVRNLIRLDERGARAPWTEEGRTYAFGFRDSLNVVSGQVCDGYLVLDQAMLFLSLANFLENGLIRKWFHADPDVARAVERIPELREPEGGPNVSVTEPGLGRLVATSHQARQLDVPRRAAPPTLDGDLGDWVDTRGRTVLRFPEHAEIGVPPLKDRFEAEVFAAWDEGNLYLAISVREDELVTEAPPQELYRDDAVELFFDPGGDGFVWGDARDFQIGISPSGPEGRPQVYAWFQKKVPEEVQVAARTEGTPEGASYTLETAIPWSLLGIAEAKGGLIVPASVAIHTVNQARTTACKLNWSYRSDRVPIELGQFVLRE